MLLKIVGVKKPQPKILFAKQLRKATVEVTVTDSARAV